MGYKDRDMTVFAIQEFQEFVSTECYVYGTNTQLHTCLDQTAIVMATFQMLPNGDSKVQELKKMYDSPFARVGTSYEHK